MRRFRPDLIPQPRLLSPFDFPGFGKPVDLEIGCGVGMHSIRYAETHPNRTLIAVEHTQERFSKFYRRFLSHGSPSNLLPVHANAMSFVAHHIPPDSIARIFFFYPNPPKSKGDIWYERPFFDFLLTRLQSDGMIRWVSNLETYGPEMDKWVRGRSDLEWLCCREVADIPSAVIRPRTHFERKYLERQERCWDRVLMKSERK